MYQIVLAYETPYLLYFFRFFHPQVEDEKWRREALKHEVNGGSCSSASYNSLIFQANLYSFISVSLEPILFRPRYQFCKFHVKA